MIPTGGAVAAIAAQNAASAAAASGLTDAVDSSAILEAEHVYLLKVAYTAKNGEIVCPTGHTKRVTTQGCGLFGRIYLYDDYEDDLVPLSKYVKSHLPPGAVVLQTAFDWHHGEFRVYYTKPNE